MYSLKPFKIIRFLHLYLFILPPLTKLLWHTSKVLWSGSITMTRFFKGGLGVLPRFLNNRSGEISFSSPLSVSWVLSIVGQKSVYDLRSITIPEIAIYICEALVSSSPAYRCCGRWLIRPSKYSCCDSLTCASDWWCFSRRLSVGALREAEYPKEAWFVFDTALLKSSESRIFARSGQQILLLWSVQLTQILK